MKWIDKLFSLMGYEKRIEPFSDTFPGEDNVLEEVELEEETDEEETFKLTIETSVKLHYVEPQDGSKALIIVVTGTYLESENSEQTLSEAKYILLGNLKKASKLGCRPLLQLQALSNEVFIADNLDLTQDYVTVPVSSTGVHVMRSSNVRFIEVDYKISVESKDGAKTISIDQAIVATMNFIAIQDFPDAILEEPPKEEDQVISQQNEKGEK